MTSVLLKPVTKTQKLKFVDQIHGKEQKGSQVD